MYDPARVIYLRYASQRVEYLIDHDQKNEHNPVLIFQAGAKLTAEACFLCFDFCRIILKLIAPLLGDTLPREEILHECQRNCNAAHDGHNGQVTDLQILSDRRAGSLQNQRKCDRYHAGADVFRDLTRDRVAGSLFHVSCGQRRAHFVRHVPHRITDGIEEVVRNNDPDSLQLHTKGRYTEHHEDAQNNDRQRQNKPRTEFSLPARGPVQNLRHDDVGNSVNDLRNDRKNNHE